MFTTPSVLSHRLLSPPRGLHCPRLMCLVNGTKLTFATACLQNGIIPHAFLKNNEKRYDLPAIVNIL